MLAVYYKGLYAKKFLETLYYGFYFKSRHVSDKHEVKKHLHRIKSRRITNFHSFSKILSGYFFLSCRRAATVDA